MVLSIAGFSAEPAQIEKSSYPQFPDKPYIFSWGNPEFRVGFNITNWMDFSIFGNIFIKNNPFYELKEGQQSTFVDIRGFKYGVAFNFFPHNNHRWAWASGTLRLGIRDEMVQYHIWDGTQVLPDQKIHEYNMFFSVTMNIVTFGDGMVLRLFKKPLSHAGAF
jgi:hypothetical protein